MARPRTEPRPETDTGQTDAGETGGFPSLADVTPGPLALTGLNQPLWLQNSTYPAALDRQAIAATLEPGVMGLTELATTQRAAGANLSVDVAAGRVVVPMTDAPNQGSALCVSTAVNNLVVGGAPGAGLSRIDLVIARVYDASLIGGSINGWQLEIVAGTPAASPAAPALPTSSIELARFTVPSGTASITTAMVTDRRVIPGVWRPYTPVWQGSITNPGLSNGSIAGRYIVRGKTCTVMIKIAFGSSTSGGQGYLFFTLPVPAALASGNTQTVQGTGRLHVPSVGAFPGICGLWSATAITMILPVDQTHSVGNWWIATDATNGPAPGCPNVSPGYNVQSGGEMWLMATYETT